MMRHYTTNGVMVLAKSAPDLMQRLPHLPTSPHLALLLRGKPKPPSCSHKAPPLKAALYPMVLHRPFEPARVTGQVRSSTHMDGYPVNQDFCIGRRLMSEWASILDFIRAKFTIHTRINSATMFLRVGQTILLSGLLLVSSTVGMPSVEFRDFSHKGPDYVALENLRFAAKDVDYLGSAQVEVLGKTYEASKYRVSVTVNVEISDAVGLVNTSVYEKHPANFDVFVVQAGYR